MWKTEDSGKVEQIPDHDFYTLREAAKILRVSERTMRQLLQSGEVFGHKLGGLWRIPHEEMERLRTSRRSDAPAPQLPEPSVDEDELPDAPYGDYDG